MSETEELNHCLPSDGGFKCDFALNSSLCKGQQHQYEESRGNCHRQNWEEAKGDNSEASKAYYCSSAEEEEETEDKI